MGYFKNQKGIPSVIIKDTRIPIKVTQKSGNFYVAMKQKPAMVIRSVPSNLVAQAVGLTPEDLILNEWQINVVETEVAHLMVPVKDLEALQKAVSSKILLKELSGKYGFEGCYLFTTNHPSIAYLAETRFFNPGIGIEKDPATGTAAGPLAGYLERLGYIKKEKDYLILQGTAVKHPSSIHVKISEDRIWVSGSSIIVMEGTLLL